MILEQCCASITFAEDGRQALTLFGSQPFDIVLMDLQMPVMDGLSAIRAIRALEAERAVAPTPIVALSANAMTHQVAEARDAATWWRRLPFAILVAGLLFFGIFPNTLANRIRPAAVDVVRLATKSGPAPAVKAAPAAHAK